MKKKLIGANFKMNKTNAEITTYFKDFLQSYSPSDAIEVTIAPQIASLSFAHQFFSTKNLYLSAQNCRYEANGAFTGESSLSLLKEIGVRYVIVGHGERRNIFKETDDIVQKKVAAIINAGLRPILCVGENLEQKEKNQTEQIVSAQLSKDLE